MIKKKSPFQFIIWEMKGQFYIIWFKYPFIPHPRQKLEDYSYNQRLYNPHSFFQKQSWHSFIHNRLIVRAAAAAVAAAAAAEDERRGRTWRPAGSAGMWRGTSTAGLQSRYELQLCRQVWHHAGGCDVVCSLRLPSKKQEGNISRFMKDSGLRFNLWIGKRGCSLTPSSWRFQKWVRRILLWLAHLFSTKSRTERRI